MKKESQNKVDADESIDTKEEISQEDFFQNVVPGLSKAEYEQIRANALEKAKSAKHNWRQKGNQIVCNSCVFPHASYIPPTKRLVGIRGDGMPILEDI